MGTVPWFCMDNDAWTKNATMHYVDSRQPRGLGFEPHQRLCDVIHVNMKLLNLSKKDAKNRAAWS